MNTTKTKLLYWAFAFLFLLLFVILKSNANNHHSIISYDTSVQSFQKCSIQNSATLNCHSYHQTTAHTCGAAAVMVLMHYYGKLSSKDMNEQTELRIAAEMGGGDGGTTPSQVESWLGDHGFQVNSGSRISTDRLIEDIDKRVPVLVAFDNHWLVADGYTKGATSDDDEIFFADSCCNVRVMGRSVIDSKWGESHLPSNHCSSDGGSYIVATPK